MKKRLPDMLDYIMNNKKKNTDKDPMIDYVIIPSSAIKSGKVKLQWGIIESGSDENKLANDLFEKKSQRNTDINLMALEALSVDKTPLKNR
jgi:hypothetical protein